MPKRIDRPRLKKLLGLLGSHHDGEVLNAARRIDAMIRDSALTWDQLIADDAAPPGSDLERIDQLLGCPTVADVLKLRLKAMRGALLAGRLAEADLRLLRVLHRKAVVEGAIVEA